MKMDNVRQDFGYHCPYCNLYHKQGEKCQTLYNQYGYVKPYINVFMACILESLKVKRNPLPILKKAAYQQISLKDFRLPSEYLSWVQYDDDVLVHFFSKELHLPRSRFHRGESLLLKELCEFMAKNKNDCELNIQDHHTIDAEYAIYDFVENDCHDTFCNPEIVLSAFKKEEWHYALLLNGFNISIDYDRGQQKDTITFCGIDYYIDRKNYMGKTFREIYDYNWEDIAINVPSDSMEASSWIKKIHEASLSMRWKRYYDDTDNRNNFFAGYGNRRVRLCCKDYGGYRMQRLYIQTDIYSSICLNNITSFEKDPSNIARELRWTYKLLGDGEYSVNIPVLEELEQKAIEWSDKKDLSKSSDIVRKNLNYADVIVLARSNLCSVNHHTVIPCIGNVPVLTVDNKKISYQVYLGYCIQCGQYYMFDIDYEKMLRTGKPLCRLIDSIKHPVLNNEKWSGLEAESVLHALGYTVGASQNLSIEERQKILACAMDNDLVSQQNILSFLGWLIQSRKADKYQTAVSKWTEDREYVKNYKRPNMKTTISSITIGRP